MGMGWRGRNVQFTKVPRHVFADPPYVPALEPPAQSLAQDVLIPRARSGRNGASSLAGQLGDNATVALVRQAIDCFQAWKFEAGEALLERALEERHRHEPEPTTVALLQPLR